MGKMILMQRIVLPRSIGSARIKVANTIPAAEQSGREFPGSKPVEETFLVVVVGIDESGFQLQVEQARHVELRSLRHEDHLQPNRRPISAWTGANQNSKRRPTGMQAGVLLVIGVTVKLTVLGRREGMIAGTDDNPAGTQQRLYEVVI
jgi:hypothetical protein